MATWSYAPDSDDDDIEIENKGITKSALLLLVDSTPEMFKPWSNGKVPFGAAIKCCQEILRRQITSGRSGNVVSLLFVGTKNSKNSSDFENIYQLFELSPVKVEMIEKLNAMKDSEDFDGFDDSIGSSADFDLKDVFWLSKIIIDEGKATNYQKKIIYFTRNDSPHDGKSNMQAEVVKKFKDIGKVSLNIVSFKEDFQREKFYSRFSEDDTSIIQADNLSSLMKTMRVREKGRRPISRSTLEIAPGVKIGIGFYSLARPAKPPQSVSINRRTNEELSKTVNEFRADSGIPVLKSEERKMIVVQGEKAIFTAEEVKHIKKDQERGVSLLAFLNMDVFDHFAWYRSPGYFLYPDEEGIAGSKSLFVALLKRCAALKKIALVKMVLTRGRSSKLACLIPSLNDPLFPQGFHVFPVPFSDEMRNYEFDFPTDPSPELLSLVEKVIKKVTNKSFDVLDVHNPMIQYKWRELERMALDMEEDDQDEFHDFTEPNEDLMIQRLGDLPDLIEKETGAFSGQKSTRSVVAATPVNMAMEAKNRRVEKLTVPVLKDFLQSQRIDAGKMRKAELVEAVYKYFKE